MKQLIASDLYGLYKKKKILLPVVILGLIAFIFIFIWYGGRANIEEAFNFAVAVNLFLYALIAIVVSSLAHRNYGCGLLSKKIAAGNSREKIYLSTLALTCAIGVALWALYFAPLLIESAAFRHDAGMTPEMIAEDRALVLKMFGYCSVGLLSVLGLCSLFTCLGMTMKSAFGSRFISIFIVLLVLVAMVSTSALDREFIDVKIIEHHDEWGDWTTEIYTYVYAKNIMSFLVCGYLKFFAPTYYFTPLDPFGGVWTNIVCAIVLFAVTTAVGLALFRKQNLK